MMCKKDLRRENFCESSAITQVTAYIEEHLGEHLLVNHLAHVACMSASKFKHAFKQSTGLSVRNYIISRRAQRVALLLQTTELSIAAIATLCGYQKSSSLAKIFKEYYGTSPLKYRQQHRKAVGL